MRSFLIGLLTFFMSVTLFQYLRCFDVLFNAGIIISVAVTQLGGLKKGLIAAATYALFTDLYVSRFLGIHLLLLIPLVFFLARISENMYEDSITLPALLLGTATLFYHVFYYLIMFLFGLVVPFSVFAKIVFIELLYNIVAGMAVYAIAFRMVKGYYPGSKNV